VDPGAHMGLPIELTPKGTATPCQRLDMGLYARANDAGLGAGPGELAGFLPGVVHADLASRMPSHRTDVAPMQTQVALHLVKAHVLSREALGRDPRRSMGQEATTLGEGPATIEEAKPLVCQQGGIGPQQGICTGPGAALGRGPRVIDLHKAPEPALHHVGPSLPIERQVGRVERHPKANDRRVWLIAITPSGDQAASQITKIDERLREELREGISRKERRELNRLLNRLRENVERVISAESE